MKPMDLEITIRVHGGGWQASVPVCNAEFVTLPGLKGTHTEAGPWLGAYGDSPTEALEELYASIGRMMLPFLLMARAAPTGSVTRE